MRLSDAVKRRKRQQQMELAENSLGQTLIIEMSLCVLLDPKCALYDGTDINMPTFLSFKTDINAQQPTKVIVPINMLQSYQDLSTEYEIDDEDLEDLEMDHFFFQRSLILEMQQQQSHWIRE